KSMLLRRSVSTHAARPSIGIHNSGAHFFMPSLLRSGRRGAPALDLLKSAASRVGPVPMQLPHTTQTFPARSPTRPHYLSLQPPSSLTLHARDGINSLNFSTRSSLASVAK